MDVRSPSTTPFAGELATPAFVTALGTLMLNDHLLKGSGVLPGWMTGKLSDLAGLFVAPMVLFAVLDGVLRVIDRPVPRRSLAAASATAIGIAFCLIKLVPAVNAVVGRMWGPMVLDPSDLIALPMSAWAVVLLTRTPPPRPVPGRIVRLITLGAALLACAATSPLPAECHPSWRLLGAVPTQLGCARGDAWVAKSGKEGFGLTIALRNATVGSGCHVRVLGATFTAGTFRAVPARMPEALDLSDTDTYAYLPFPFDNQSLWRESIDRTDLRRGLVTLEIVAGGEARRWDIVTTQEILPRHERVRERSGGNCTDPRPVSIAPAAGSTAGGLPGSPPDSVRAKAK